MSPPWWFLPHFFGLLVIGLVASCARPSSPSPTLPPPSTWTPTPIPATSPSYSTQMTPTPTVRILATAAIALDAPTPIPSATSTPLSTPLPLSPTPAAAPSQTPGAFRIDAKGPVVFPTIAPLPPGAGKRPVRLLIPALQLDAPVQEMGWKVIQDENGVRSEWDVVDNAAGHHINSAFPGEAGNVVLSGHNNIGGALFRSVCVIGEPGVDFGLGDEMILEDESGRRFIYRVNGWRRMDEANASLARRQQNARYLNPTDHAQLTLVTCWPPTSNTHRVVVTGVLTGRD